MMMDIYRKEEANKTKLFTLTCPECFQNKEIIIGFACYNMTVLKSMSLHVFFPWRIPWHYFKYAEENRYTQEA